MTVSKFALFLTATCLAIAPEVANAQSATEASANIKLGGGYANNPYGSPTSATKTGSAYSQATLDSHVQVAGEHNQISFDGMVNYKYYARLLPDDNSYRAGLGYKGHSNAQLTTHADAVYSDSAVGSLDSFNAATILGTGADLGLLGKSNRLRQLNFSAGLAYQINAHNHFTLDETSSLVRYKNNATANRYNTYGGFGTYSHDMNSHLSLGLHAGVDVTDYFTALPATTVYTGELTTTVKMSERWTLDASSGLNQLHTTGRGNQLAWSANAKLCYKSSGRAEFCANGARKFAPTGSSGTTIQTIAAGNYSYRLSEKDSLSASSSYSRNEYLSTSGPISPINQNDQYYSAQVGYSRKQTQRLSLDMNASYRKTTSAIVSRADDYGGALSLTYRLGDLH